VIIKLWANEIEIMKLRDFSIIFYINYWILNKFYNSFLINLKKKIIMVEGKTSKIFELVW